MRTYEEQELFEKKFQEVQFELANEQSRAIKMVGHFKFILTGQPRDDETPEAHLSNYYRLKSACLEARVAIQEYERRSDFPDPKKT